MHAYGLIVALAVGAGYLLVIRRAKKFSVAESLVDSLFLPVVIGGVVGARLYHVMDKWSYYSSNLIGIFEVWNGGLGIFGAIIGGFVGLIIYLKLKKIKIDLLTLLDLVAPSIALGQAIGRWGNYFNKEVLGPNNEPIFMYESLWMLTGFIFLMLVERRRVKLFHLEGGLFGVYLIWYGVGRFFLEFWRVDTAMLGDFKTAQILSLLFIALGLILIFRKSKVKL